MFHTDNSTAYPSVLNIAKQQAVVLVPPGPGNLYDVQWVEAATVKSLAFTPDASNVVYVYVPLTIFC